MMMKPTMNIEILMIMEMIIMIIQSGKHQVAFDYVHKPGPVRAWLRTIQGGKSCATGGRPSIYDTVSG